MNTASQIKSFYTSVNPKNGADLITDYEGLASECEEKANDIEQDVDLGATTYEFVDGSVLVWSDSEVRAYGGRQ